MSPSRRTFVCLSSQPWHDSMWTNKQHVMKRVAEQHRVIFVNYGGSSPFKFLARARREAPHRRFGWRELVRECHVRELSANLQVLDVWTPALPSSLHGRKLRFRLDFARRLRIVQRWLAQAGISDAVVWVYHPGYGDSVLELPHSLVVYDCVDEYSAFPEFSQARSWISEQERRLCAVADVVACTAPALALSKEPLAPGRTHLVHNVGDAEHFVKAFADDVLVPADIADLAKPVVGFIGAVSDYKLNLQWLMALAERRPRWSVVIVGPVGVADPGTDASRLAALPNVHLLGHRDYAVLPSYLKGFDVAVIPYRINDYTRAVFPIKFFEFMASGRPLVISDLPAVAEFWDAVRVARTEDEFIAECQRASGEPGESPARARRIALARQNSWPARVRALLELVEAAFARAPRAPRVEPPGVSSVR